MVNNKEENISKKRKRNIPIIEMDQIQKYFGESCAVNKVHFEVDESEVIGLIGPNGAGKSTLMKIITGDVVPTAGTIKIDGMDVLLQSHSRKVIHSKGIFCVYQELSLCKKLSVYENFMLTHYKQPHFKGFNWRKKAKKYIKEVLDQIFPENGIKVSEIVDNYSFSQQQMIEIARAISLKDLRVLILDEPTSSLSFERISQLHNVIHNLKENGISVIYVTHKLEEIKRVCDRITIMRNGLITGEVISSDVTISDLITFLGGAEEWVTKTEREVKEYDPILKVSNLTTDFLNEINIEAHKGEIVGISGLSESGQEDLLYELFKASTRRGGKSGILIPKKVTFVSGDRQSKGIFPYWSIADNIIISTLDLLCKWGVIDKRKADSLARHWYEKLKFRATSHKAAVTSLSGGNQQKALIARGLALDADVVLLDDPTRGVDIKTKQELYLLLQEARDNGKTIIWYSTEDEEMLKCDKVYIMREGTIVRELKGNKTSVKEIVNGYIKEKEPDSPISAKSDGFFRKNFVFKREMVPYLTLFVILVLNIIFNSRIASYYGIDMIFSTTLPLVFVGFAQMLIVQLGDIDLGAGAGAALINVIAATVMYKNLALGLLIFVIFIGCYAAMGALIYIRKLPALVTTLAASFIWFGIGLVIQPQPGGLSPDWLNTIYSFKFPGIPTPLLIGLVFAGIIFLIMKRTRYGVILRGVGDNPTSVRHAGWSCLAARVVTYAMAGFFLVLAGLYFTAVSHGSDIKAMRSYTMYSLAVIVLGGIVFTGGISQPFGVLAAAFAIILISTLLVFIGVRTEHRHAIVGTILILSFLPGLFIKSKRR